MLPQPDMASTDYVMFLKLKMALKQTRFHSVKENEGRVTAILKTIPEEEFLASFQQLYEDSEACIERGGIYVEN